METYDFTEFEKEIDNTVISLVNLFCKKDEELTIREAKNVIKTKLMFDPNSYKDYKNDSFNFISTLLSSAKCNNLDVFINVLISGTFLLESFIK